MNAMARPVAIEWLYEFVRYRELFFFLVWRDVKIRYKQTLLGASWAIIQPFFMMVVFSLLLNRVANINTDGYPYPIFSYAGLVPWTYFQYAVPLAGNSLIANSRLISKVYFPRAIIPASSALSGIVDFGIASLMLVGMMFYFHIPFSAEFLWWPILIVPLALFTTAVGMFFAALNVKYRDIKYTIPFFVQAMLFVSPIIYPLSDTGRFSAVLRLNPLFGIVNAFRASVLPAQSIDWSELGVSMLITLVLFAIASVYFYRTERSFADLV